MIAGPDGATASVPAQMTGLQLIPSEVRGPHPALPPAVHCRRPPSRGSDRPKLLLQNFTSRAVLDAVGSIMTNKYSEGYPYKRYGRCNPFVRRDRQPLSPRPRPRRRRPSLQVLRWERVHRPGRDALPGEGTGGLRARSSGVGSQRAVAFRCFISAQRLCACGACR